MEKVLLFRTGDTETAAIADMLAAMKVRCESVPENAFHQTIGALAAGKTAPIRSGIFAEKTAPARAGAEAERSESAKPDAEAEQGGSVGSGAGTAQSKPIRSDTAAGSAVQGESLMLFCNVSEKHFNRALALMRSRAVKVDYKAVLTPINQGWNVLRLYAELAREKAQYEQMKG